MDTDYPQYFRITNFEKYQHYKDRKPPWIKLYRELWRDPRFFSLTEGQRYQLISLFVLASQHDNLLKVDQQWLRHELATTKAIELNTLVASGWIEVLSQSASKVLAASEVLAACKQDAIVETETEVQRQNTETEGYMPFGEFGHVRLTEKQHVNLVSKLNGNLQRYIDRLDRWGEDQPSKFGKKKSHYATILSWADQDGAKTAVATKERIAPLEHPEPSGHSTTHLCLCCALDHKWDCSDDPLCSLPYEIPCRSFIESRRT